MDPFRENREHKLHLTHIPCILTAKVFQSGVQNEMAAHPVDVHVGRRLRLRRNMLNISQEELGSAVGVTFQQIQKYERGSNRVGSSRLYEIAKILEVPVEYFFDNFNPELPPEQIGFAEEKPKIHNKEIFNEKETIYLVQAYYNIRSPEVRSKLLSLMRALESETTKNLEEA